MQKIYTGIILGMMMIGITGCGSMSGGENEGADYSQITKIWARDCQDANATNRFDTVESGVPFLDKLTCIQWVNLNDEAGFKPYITKENFRKGRYNDTSGDTAATVCKNYDDGQWRLPTKHEFLSLVIDVDSDPTQLPYRGKIPTHFYDRNKIPFQYGITWTTTPVSGHPEYRWFVNLDGEKLETNSCKVDEPAVMVFCVHK